MSFSTSEENYLKAIFKIAERKGVPVSTNAIAKELHTSAASVTDMLQKLAEKQLVQYRKYRGVELTSDGKEVATQLIRKHRLWESFLVEKLGFSWDEVHDIAEQLEHIDSPLLVNRLDAFLDFPKFDPHGDPIPDRNGKFTLRSQIPLHQLSSGEVGIVIAVQNHEKGYLTLLDELDIQIGTSIRLIETFDFDNSLKIEVSDSREHLISDHISKNIYVRKV